VSIVDQDLGSKKFKTFVAKRKWVLLKSSLFGNILLGVCHWTSLMYWNSLINWICCVSFHRIHLEFFKSFYKRIFHIHIFRKRRRLIDTFTRIKWSRWIYTFRTNFASLRGNLLLSSGTQNAVGKTFWVRRGYFKMIIKW